MKRILRAALLAGLFGIFSNAEAQIGNLGEHAWPEVPEVNSQAGQEPEEAASSRVGRGINLRDWPGTEQSQGASPSYFEPGEQADTLEDPDNNTQRASRSRRRSSRSRQPRQMPIPDRLLESREKTSEDQAEADTPREVTESNVAERTETEEPQEAATITGTVQTAVPVVAVPVATTSRPVEEEDEPLEDMIGQMIVLAFDGAQPDEESVEEVIEQIESGEIGGVLVTGRNVHSVQQLRSLMRAFREAESKLPPFLMIAHEGGPGQTLAADKGFSAYPSAGELGQSNDPLNAYNIYRNMGEELASFGFNVNLGPVLGIETGDSSIALSERRSYGSSAKHVVAFAKAFRLAHEQNAIMTVPKYFPGGNSARRGTEQGKSAKQDGLSKGGWNVSQLQPYRELLAGSKSGMVMVGHLVDPGISDELGMPASFSAKAVQATLRDEIGFQGVAITDDLEADSLKQDFPFRERVVHAFAAGNDIALIGDAATLKRNLPGKIVAIVKYAIAEGKLTRERIEESYNRIVNLKRNMAASTKAIVSAKQESAKTEASAH